MSVYVVSYDLHKDRKYEPLWQTLKGAGAARLLESLWILKSTLSAGAIRDALKKVIDSDDAISVIEVAPGADWANTANVYKAGADMLT